MSDVRASPLAGRWYPANPQQLAQSIDGYLRDADPPPVPGTLVGLVAPHAGYRYSGPVAGYAFKPLQGLSVDTVAVVGPLHSLAEAPLLTSGHDAYATPLGQVPLDAETLAELRRLCSVPITPIFNDPEHSLEMELPFLQATLSGPFRLIPVMIRDDSAAVCLALAEALAKALAGRRHLLVASSDLSHFYPQPVARRYDDYMLSQVETLDPLKVLRAEEEGRGFACGRGAIAVVLAAARQLGATTARVVRYASSGDVTGDYDSVVGYGAALIWKN